MKEILYFNRNKNNRFSIENVTNFIEKEVAKKVPVYSFDVPNITASLHDLIGNIYYVFKHRKKTAINHVTGDIHYAIIGLIGCKSVLTIHDLVFLEGKQNKISYWLKYFLWLYLPVKLADQIICISEKTKQEVLKHVNTQSISVIYNPIILAKQFTQQIKPFREDCPKILLIGTKSNKNIENTILALNGIKCNLLIIGKLNDAQLQLLMSSRIPFENKYNLTDDEIADAYYESDIVSFMSTYEGFGMPIVEGQLAGCAVLTSNIAPMTEVGASSVVYADPYNVLSIHEAFNKIINDKIYRDRKINEGFENAKRFSPEKIASEYMKIYDEL